jgi:hypothetical protein
MAVRSTRASCFPPLPCVRPEVRGPKLRKPLESRRKARRIRLQDRVHRKTLVRRTPIRQSDSKVLRPGCYAFSSRVSKLQPKCSSLGCLDAARPQPTRQPEAVPTGLEGDSDAFDPVSCLHRFLVPSMQQLQQCALVNRELLQGRSTLGRHLSQSQPAAADREAGPWLGPSRGRMPVAGPESGLDARYLGQGTPDARAASR